MSTAVSPIRLSISSRMPSVQGSAPKMPTRSDERFASRPWRSNSSAIASMYDGVTMMMSGLKSLMSCTCRSVMPPPSGMTQAPSASPP